MPDIPNIHAAAMLGLTAVSLLLFSRQSIPLESSCLAILALLTVGFELFPYTADTTQIDPLSFYSGFGHKALVAVCALMIVGQGLVTTGALVPLGRWISRLWRTSPLLSLLLTLVAGALGSAFINNTPIVVLLIPIIATAARQNNLSMSPLLMPMNFSTLLGGTCTTIGTSTNLLVVGVAADLGMRKFGMFDFAGPAVIAGGIGLLYLWLIAPRLLKHEETELEKDVERLFTFQLEFPDDSPSIGTQVRELQKKTDNKLKILKIRKAGEDPTGSGTLPLPDAKIAAGDRITVSGTADELKEFEAVLGATAYGSDTIDVLAGKELQLAQIVLLDSSPLVNRTLKATRFAESYGVTVVAIHRASRLIRAMPQGVGSIPLHAGDILLVQGHPEHIDAIKSIDSLLLLDARKDLPMSGKGSLAIAILVAVVATAAFGLLPISTSAICGVLAMLITGCMDWRGVRNALSVPVIMIVVVSLALGSALTQTGATEYIAQVFLYLTADASAATILSALILLMALLTNIVSNNAAAVIGTPIAISMATQLGVSPEAFVLAVLFGANLSFATPMAYKTNVLVMSAGNYSFNDFVRAGLPLVLLLWVVYSVLLTRLYGI